MKKFIVIDHSLCSLQGHHYECSISVAEAAARAGYNPIILANRVLPRSLLSGDIKIIPLFEVDWFNQPVEIVGEQAKPDRNPKWNSIFKQGNIKEWVRYQRHIWNYNYPQRSIFFEKVEGSIQRLIQWLKEDLRLLRTIPLSNTFWGLFKIIWGLIRFTGQLSIKACLKLVQKIKKPKQTPLNPIQSFTQNLAQVLPTLALTSDDHIFIHTLGIEQLEELYHFLLSCDRSSLPTYHILLRRDTQDPLVINAKGMGLKACLQACYDHQLWPNQIRFYTDTEDLVRRHNALSPVQLLQIPVPFRQEKLQTQPSRAKDQSIHIVYLGDARSEKGYQYLPDLVAALWLKYLQSGKARFTIQSNYNIEGGELSILAAKLQLAQYPERKVRLINDPMSPDKYYQLLASADIVLLPYNPQNYQRTSGVLTEALAAGKPVIVPARSWLAQQVDNSRARIYNHPKELSQSVIDVIENLGELTIAAQQFSPYWREQQSPDRLIQCLIQPPNFSLPAQILDSAQPSNSPISSIPNLLLFISGESLLEGATKLTKEYHPLAYFCQQGYAVYLVVYPLFSSQNTDPENWDQFVQQVRQALQDYNLKGLWVLKPRMSLPMQRDIDPNQYQQYLDDVYHQRATLLREWIESNHLEIPTDLIQLLQTIKINLVYIDSVWYEQCLKLLDLDPAIAIAEVDRLLSYHYALLNRREVIDEELAWEIKQLQQFSVLLTAQSSFAEKLKELTHQVQIYAIEPLTYTALEKRERVINYDRLLTQAFQAILGSPTLSLKNGLKASLKIAILYPWGDIQERKSGASQRTGLLLDYLKEQGHTARFCTMGLQRSRWQDGVYYDDYEPHFAQENLVQSVYADAYRSWGHSLDLSVNRELFDSEEPTNTWLPWIYYQFRFDPDFQLWLDKITDWAEVVILEYPFWAESLARICDRKKVPWILTAHDVLAKNLPAQSILGQIALAEELQALRQASAVVTLSPDDQRFFENYGIPSHCVPIGIDLQKIEQSLQGDSPMRLQSYLDNLGIKLDLARPFCLFVGSQHLPNIEAVQQIRNWSQKQDPSHNFVIVGSCWEPEAGEGFLSLGKIEANLLGLLYQNAALVLAPLSSGTGMSVKILEAMVYGKVILGTAIAFRGYPIQSGVHVVLCDTLEDYPAQIEQLLGQPQNLQHIGKQAQELAQAYDYRQLYQTYLDLMI